jgi:hypothetical protein
MTATTVHTSNSKMLQLELMWWIMTSLVALLVLLPIALKLPDYPFWTINILFIATFITTTRYIFLLASTFLARRLWWKLAIIFLFIPFVFYLIQELNGFQTYLDEEGVEAVVGALPFQDQQAMYHYVRNEMLLFGTGAIVGSIVFPFRLIIAIWRVRNRKEQV